MARFGKADRGRILGRSVLIAATVLLAYFVAITDSDFFNVAQLIGIHHEPVFLFLIATIGAEVFIPNRYFVGLMFLLGLIASLAVIADLFPGLAS